MYEFGEDIGGLERSRYFGYSKDLYHRDHFDGGHLKALPRSLCRAEAESELHIGGIPANYQSSMCQEKKLR